MNVVLQKCCILTLEKPLKNSLLKCCGCGKLPYLCIRNRERLDAEVEILKQRRKRTRADFYINKIYSYLNKRDAFRFYFFLECLKKRSEKIKKKNFKNIWRLKLNAYLCIRNRETENASQEVRNRNILNAWANE